MHQPHPERSGAPHRDAGAEERDREAVAREGRHDDVEGIRRVAAVAPRVSERVDRLGEVPERPGPSVGQHQGHRVGADTAAVDVMDGYLVEHHAVVLEAVHRRFVGAPVVAVAPVVDQLFEPGPVGPVAPVLVAGIGGPSNPGQALVEVVQDAVLDGDGEALGRGHRSGDADRLAGFDRHPGAFGQAGPASWTEVRTGAVRMATA